jgi:hypothetical protein
MRSKSTRVVFVLLCSSLVGPGRVHGQATRSPLPTVQLPREVERVLRDYERAWAARDAAALAALFHEDGFVLSMGRPPARGRAAIRSHYANAGGELHLRPIGYAAQDTIGYIVGMYRGSSQQEMGKFLLALRRAHARQPWLIAADMDNPNSRQEE